MSTQLISYNNSSTGSGQTNKRPATWNAFGKVRDFEKNSIPHSEMPPARIYREGEPYETTIESTECRLWSSDWNRQISPEGDAFLEEAACLGYTEDQSLAVMFVSKFDVKKAKERLLKFRNIYIPNLSAADQLIFQDLITSSLGKKFSSYRCTKLAHVSVKELVNYYYYQKQMAKRRNLTSSTLTRIVLESFRQNLTTEFLKEIRFSVYQKNSQTNNYCNVCFKKSNDNYRAGNDHFFCSTCYAFYARHKRLPPLVHVERVTLPYSSPEGLAERGGARGQENCTILANSNFVSLMREQRKQAQKLTRVRKATPSKVDRDYLINQIDAILSQENCDHSINNNAEIIIIE